MPPLMSRVTFSMSLFPAGPSIPLVFQKNLENPPVQEMSRLESFRASEIHSIIPEGEGPHLDDHPDEAAPFLYPHETEVPGSAHGEP